MADETNTGAMSGMGVPTLEDWQHWTLVMGRAQQMLMEFWAESAKGQPMPAWSSLRRSGSASREHEPTQ